MTRTSLRSCTGEVYSLLMGVLDRPREVSITEATQRGAAGMIDVAVGQQDALDRDAELAHRVEDPIDVAAGIDHRAPLAGIVEDDRAVLQERGDGNDRGLQIGHRCASHVVLRCDRRLRPDPAMPPSCR